MPDYKGKYAPVRDAGAQHESYPTGYRRAELEFAIQDGTQVPAAAAVGEKVFLGDFNPDFIPDADLSKIHFDAAGAGVTIDVGDDNDTDALVNDLSIAAAGSDSLLKAVDRANYGKPLWQLLGYAKRPDGRIRLYATIGGAAVGAATDLFWKFVGTNA